MPIEELLREIYSLLNTIRWARKGSIGTINNVYLPQLPVKRVDELTAQVRAAYLRINQQEEP